MRDAGAAAVRGTPAAAAPGVADERSRSRDRRWSVALLIASPFFAAACAIDGFFQAFKTDACASPGCIDALIDPGIWIGTAGPPVVGVLTVVVGVVRLARGRTASWVPLAGGTAEVLLVVAGAALVALGTGPARG